MDIVEIFGGEVGVSNVRARGRLVIGKNFVLAIGWDLKDAKQQVAVVENRYS